MDDNDNVATCCSFLANYYMKKGDLNTASPFAQRCLEYDSTKEEGRSLLRKISQIHHRHFVLPESFMLGSPRGNLMNMETPTTAAAAAATAAAAVVSTV
ncbi:unnamed protein product [Gongylonema pulchrum]|uniref:TPR_REGION domain-containing protein n=1 Tax=Gongylonema pulchrum TaxID=637853 RepID=A0A183DAK1_9BILA|nr:unnamed protein product [Gongylonema pulchrum]